MKGEGGKEEDKMGERKTGKGRRVRGDGDRSWDRKREKAAEIRV
jgi:hypothetical protein